MLKKIYIMIIIASLNFFIWASTTLADEGLSLHSESAILMEAESGQVLAEKNANQQMYPASVTKIATAIYVIENGNLSEEVEISENATEADGTTVFLTEGEEVSLGKLVKGLLINSGNDAGVAIAEHMSGSVSKFSEEMTEFFEEKAGIENTNFDNPHGLYNDNHYTTAEDLAKITKYALQNDQFVKLFGMKSVDWNSKTWETTILNHHRMVKGEIPYDGVTGGKNGFVSQSGFTLVTTAEQEGMHLIAVTLKTPFAEQSYEDTAELLDYGFENYEPFTIDEGTSFMTKGKEFKNSEDLTYVHEEGSKVEEEIKEDGKLVIEDNGELLKEFQLDKVEKKQPTMMKNNQIEKEDQESIAGSLYLYIGIGVAGVVLIIVLFLLWRRRKKRKNNIFI
ncbi:D-alanyl-D-alanine carboxypeptidase family protein [Oceanobacillus sp. 1P07AA]|uniref:D-alanyl-D-alanine carboxypeptidase family protein n=1 Tax=Oceanobacillus sp. 1P07AA TaxID=3132293 RepID=UPI0039A60ACD